MSKQQHTPGPWVASHSVYSETCDFEVCEDRENGDVIAGEYGIPRAEDARLISAAPELLEALELFGLPLSGNDSQDRAEFGDYAVDRELIRRAAIAKARGES